MQAISYYDDKYRNLQTSADIDTGVSRINRAYSFNGKLLTESEVLIHGVNYDSVVYAGSKQYFYDHADRLLNLVQTVDNTETITVSENTYNELGQPLTKKLHQSSSHPSPLQKLDYTYNIRGWLNGINQPYYDGTGYEENDLFNLALHYNTTNMSGSSAQYNGNIAETLWKGGYDEYLRGYKYAYDKANRLLEADYGFKYLNIYNDTTWDFTMRYNEKVDGYDRNGNIKRLERFHGAWNRIDDLNYASYDGNKLLRVEDAIYSNLPVGFHDGNSWIDDYRYDQNGNMTFDYNKSIDSISYNHLNLPEIISIPGKGTIIYKYDATGNKISKTVVDQSGASTVTTTYLYRGPAVYKNGQIEYIIGDEGRLRPKRIDTTQVMKYSNRKYTYDYFLKDHLGNVRMVLSTEQQTDQYAATMETAAAAKEEQLFTNLSSTRYVKPSGFDTDTANHQVARLNGDINTSGNSRVGTSLVIKVMAGDTISLATRAWYSGSTQAPPNGLSPIADELVSLLTTGVVGAGGTHGGNIPTQEITDGLEPVVSDLLSNAQSYDNSKPKAFLNWMIVDEEFKKVTSTNHMGAVQVPTISSGDTSHLLVGPANMVVRRGGWLYVFVSNESNQNVFFDGLVVSHKRGPVVEQSDFYAFGLEIPGLSSHANTVSTYNDNRNKYNGKELQDKEFADGSGLAWEDYGARMYDPQIGRWMVSDPLSELSRRWSPYNYAYNNPIRFVDPDGMRPYIPDNPSSSSNENIISSNDKIQFHDNIHENLRDMLNGGFTGVTESSNEPYNNDGNVGQSDNQADDGTQQGPTSNSQATKTITVLIVDGKAASAMDVGHTGVQLEEKVYNFYPTDKGNDGAWGVGDLLSSPGQVVTESRAKFDATYQHDGITAFTLKVTEEQYNKISKAMEGYAKSPGTYSLFGRQCTSIVGNALVAGGVPVYHTSYYVSTGPIAGNWVTTRLEGTDLLSPSTLSEMLKQPVNKALVAAYNYYKTK